MKDIFKNNGHWYKGNLHMHTTLSDGRLTPEQAAVVYKKAGYDFISITDHWVQSKGGTSGSLLVFPGCEFNTGDMKKYPVFHIVGIGMKKKVELCRSESLSPQKIISEIRLAGGLAILAHPAWSVTDPENCMTLDGLSGAEIYNTFSGLPWNCRPDSAQYFDIWAVKGKLVNCVASDDSHYYEGEETRSFTMVNAKGPRASDIMEALAEGNFYASQGPRFKSVSVDRSSVEVECSESEFAVFYSNTVWCSDRVAHGKITHVSYKIKPTDTYVRVELIDKNGRKAWTSPFSVDLDHI